MKPDSISESLGSSLRVAAVGLVFAVLTILFGCGMGIVFGFNEDAIKSRLRASTVAVRESVYRGDDAAIKAVLDKSWLCMQRAQAHAGGAGATTLGLIVLACLVGVSRRLRRVIGFGLGAGGLGYSIFLMWVAYRAPAFGSVGAASESIEWLAWSASGAFVVAKISVLALLIGVIVLRRQPVATSD